MHHQKNSYKPQIVRYSIMEHSKDKKRTFWRELIFVLWAGTLALLAYSLVYALRKPFSAATFEEFEVWGISYKILVATSQIVGYLIAKFAGIKILSEMQKSQRLWFIGGFALLAEAALVMFAIIPLPYNFLAMFFNGIALGCMWGVIFSFIEGRRATDLLASILGVSIVISSGLAKSIGLYCMNDLGISPFYMPAVIGAFAMPLLVVTGWLMTRLPAPTDADIEIKQERKPLNGKERKELFKRFGFSLTMILLANFLVIVLRDIKEDFLVDIISAKGSPIDTWLFAKIDSIVSITILVLFGTIVLVRDNMTALRVLLGLIIVGSLALMGTSLYYQELALSTTTWLFVQSLALYIVFLSFQTIFFDRFIAAYKISGNVVFFIAMVDAVGYLGTCIMLFVKEFSDIQLNWLEFYNAMAIVVGSIASIAFILTIINLTKRDRECQKSVVSLWTGREPQWTMAASHRLMVLSKCSKSMELTLP